MDEREVTINLVLTQNNSWVISGLIAKFRVLCYGLDGRIEDKAAADRAYIILAPLRNHILQKIRTVSNESAKFIRIY